MARHTRIYASIWDDPDFLALKMTEQHAYFLLMSNKGLSHCGVVTYIPSRFEHLAVDMSVKRFTAAVAGLQRARFVILDERTQELLVRTHIRHDGVLNLVNMGKACGTAFETVVSQDIRRVIGDELARLMKEHPNLSGWVGLAATSPMAHAMACGMESGMP